MWAQIRKHLFFIRLLINHFISALLFILNFESCLAIQPIVSHDGLQLRELLVINLFGILCNRNNLLVDLRRVIITFVYLLNKLRSPCFLMRYVVHFDLGVYFVPDFLHVAQEVISVYGQQPRVFLCSYVSDPILLEFYLASVIALAVHLIFLLNWIIALLL